MLAKLQRGSVKQLQPDKQFLQLEDVAQQNINETALEVPLFDFTTTEHQLGARLVRLPANRAFARHIHPNAHHLVYVVDGTGVLEYDNVKYTLKPGEYCLVCKGIAHKLGAGEDGLLAMIVNSPTYDNGDPAHVHYLEAETLVSTEIENDQLAGSIMNARSSTNEGGNG